eukprot:jgi/Ulvmu1/1915/UM012_0075.1
MQRHILLFQNCSFCNCRYQIGQEIRFVRSAYHSRCIGAMSSTDESARSISLEKCKPTIVSEKITHQRWLTMYDRHVHFEIQDPSNGSKSSRVVEYDIVGAPQADFSFAVTFPYHPAPAGAEVTILREYSQGANGILYNLPTGGFSPEKHSSLQACAEAELSEEAALRGGSWYSLLPEGHRGVHEVKWCCNRFSPFLVIDPEVDPNPGPLDAEELLEVQRVSIPRLQEIMISGNMLLPALATCTMALARLKQLGHDV